MGKSTKTAATNSFIRLKLRSKTGVISFKDIPVEKHSNEEIIEMSLVETEIVENLVKKVVLDGPELKVVH